LGNSTLVVGGIDAPGLAWSISGKTGSVNKNPKSMAGLMKAVVTTSERVCCNIYLCCVCSLYVSVRVCWWMVPKVLRVRTVQTVCGLAMQCSKDSFRTLFSLFLLSVHYYYYYYYYYYYSYHANVTHTV